jgi:hypothetical protein
VTTRVLQIACSWLPWLTLPIAVRLACVVLTLDRFQDLVPMTPRAAALQLSYAILFGIGAAQTS